MFNQSKRTRNKQKVVTSMYRQVFRKLLLAFKLQSLLATVSEPEVMLTLMLNNS